MADYYETVVRESKADPKIAANWIAVELSGFLNRDNKDIAQSPVTAPMMAGLLEAPGRQHHLRQNRQGSP